MCGVTGKGNPGIVITVTVWRILETVVLTTICGGV
jgi:hypothetical protein